MQQAVECEGLFAQLNIKKDPCRLVREGVYPCHIAIVLKTNCHKYDSESQLS